jgi:hypothetical protein
MSYSSNMVLSQGTSVCGEGERERAISGSCQIYDSIL